MKKAELEKLLHEERKKSKDVKIAYDMAVKALGALSTGLGRKRDGEWSAVHLASDTLVELARLVK